MDKQKSKIGAARKYLVLILMMLSMTTIYILPYLRFSYFTPLQQAMGLMDNATAYGTLVSVYGIMNLICYLPGGIIADKFDAKKLLVFSMVSTGILGLWMSTWPGYESLMIIHILFGITTVLTFWSSSVKIVNMLASADEQGQLFGFLEGGRGLVGLGVSAATLALFAFLSAKINEVVGVTAVVIVTSVLMIIIGVVLAFLLPKSSAQDATNASAKDSLSAIKKALTLPITWCLAAIIFTCSVMTTTGSFFSPYLEGACGLTAVAASTFAVLRSNGVVILAAPIAGIVSRKMKKSTGVIMITCVGLIGCSLILGLVPGNSSLLVFLIAIMLVYTFFYSSNRAVYWATIEETGTPKNMVGTVTGVASMIGFLPDTFLNTMYGSFLDNNEFATAYRYIFFFCVAISCVGLFAAFYANRVVKRHQAREGSAL